MMSTQLSNMKHDVHVQHGLHNQHDQPSKHDQNSQHDQHDQHSQHDLHGYWKLVSCRNLPALAKSLDWDPTFPRYKMMSATGPKGLILHVSGSGSDIRIDYIMNNISRYIEDLVIGDTKYIVGASGKPRVVSTEVEDGVVFMRAQSRRHLTTTKNERRDDILLQEIISSKATCSLLYKRVERFSQSA